MQNFFSESRLIHFAAAGPEVLARQVVDQLKTEQEPDTHQQLEELIGSIQPAESTDEKGVWEQATKSLSDTERAAVSANLEQFEEKVGATTGINEQLAALRSALESQKETEAIVNEGRDEDEVESKVESYLERHPWVKRGIMATGIGAVVLGVMSLLKKRKNKDPDQQKSGIGSKLWGVIKFAGISALAFVGVTKAQDMYADMKAEKTKAKQKAALAVAKKKREKDEGDLGRKGDKESEEAKGEAVKNEDKSEVEGGVVAGGQETDEEEGEEKAEDAKEEDPLESLDLESLISDEEEVQRELFEIGWESYYTWCRTVGGAVVASEGLQMLTALDLKRRKKLAEGILFPKGGASTKVRPTIFQVCKDRLPFWKAYVNYQEAHGIRLSTKYAVDLKNGKVLEMLTKKKPFWKIWKPKVQAKHLLGAGVETKALVGKMPLAEIVKGGGSMDEILELRSMDDLLKAGCKADDLIKAGANADDVTKAVIAANKAAKNPITRFKSITALARAGVHTDDFVRLGGKATAFSKASKWVKAGKIAGPATAIGGFALDAGIYNLYEKPMLQKRLDNCTDPFERKMLEKRMGIREAQLGGDFVATGALFTPALPFAAGYLIGSAGVQFANDSIYKSVDYMLLTAEKMEKDPPHVILNKIEESKPGEMVSWGQRFAANAFFWDPMNKEMHNANTHVRSEAYRAYFRQEARQMQFSGLPIATYENLTEEEKNRNKDFRNNRIKNMNNDIFSNYVSAAELYIRKITNNQYTSVDAEILHRACAYAFICTKIKWAKQLDPEKVKVDLPPVNSKETETLITKSRQAEEERYFAQAMQAKEMNPDMFENAIKELFLYPIKQDLHKLEQKVEFTDYTNILDAEAWLPGVWASDEDMKAIARKKFHQWTVRAIKKGIETLKKDDATVEDYRKALADIREAMTGDPDYYAEKYLGHDLQNQYEKEGREVSLTMRGIYDAL